MISHYIWCEKVEKRRDTRICQNLNCRWLLQKEGNSECSFVPVKEKRVKKLKKKGGNITRANNGSRQDKGGDFNVVPHKLLDSSGNGRL